MVNIELRESISKVNPDAVVFDNPSYDGSIIGVSTTGCVVYDKDKMILEFSVDNNVTPLTAKEFIEYNTIQSINNISSSIRPIIIQCV